MADWTSEHLTLIEKRQLEHSILSLLTGFQERTGLLPVRIELEFTESVGRPTVISRVCVTTPLWHAQNQPR